MQISPEIGTKRTVDWRGRVGSIVDDGWARGPSGRGHLEKVPIENKELMVRELGKNTLSGWASRQFVSAGHTWVTRVTATLHVSPCSGCERLSG